MSNDEVLDAACTYAKQNQLTLIDQLGYGIHGTVWATYVVSNWNTL
jgi:hypothetical protein